MSQRIIGRDIGFVLPWFAPSTPKGLMKIAREALNIDIQLATYVVTQPEISKVAHGASDVCLPNEELLLRWLKMTYGLIGQTNVFVSYVVLPVYMITPNHCRVLLKINEKYTCTYSCCVFV